MQGLERIAITPENYQQISLLRNTVSILEENNLPYFVVGSMAVGALTGIKILERHDGLIKDLDILTSEPETVARILMQNDLLKQDPRDRKVDLGINNCLDLRIPNKPSIRFKSICYVLDPAIFIPIKARIDTIEFTTLPPETLFHLYCLTGSFRKDDWHNALLLGRWIKDHPTYGLHEGRYQTFHAFSKNRIQKYPYLGLLWKLDRGRNVEGKNSMVRACKEKLPGLIPVLSQSRALLDRFVG